MIHKITEIQNCGKFVNYKPSEKDYKWNGIFTSINTIYAENGSGKTTFTQILKSLSGKNCELVEKRRSIHTQSPIKISFFDENHKLFSYKSNDWTKHIPCIEVYDYYYSESNIYIVSLGSYESPSSFYDIVPNGYELIKQIKLLRHKRKNASTYIRNIKREIKLTSNSQKKEELDNEINKHIIKKERISYKINKLESELTSNIKKIGKTYIEKANSYLNSFNPNLKLKDVNKKGQQLVYYISINGFDVRSDISNVPLKHTLSEGDKSSLSLSFFLAKLDLLPNIQNRIIVFDDPITSFDTRRRIMTISLLSRIANKSSQFFLLSHDLNFIKEFSTRHTNSTNLKIIWQNNTSVFVKHDIKLETMTGISKDIYTLQNYINNGAITDIEKREVIRCIRPILEGILRLKYFNIFNDKEWLGNFLNHIKESEEGSVLYHLNEYLEELTDINDYCKQYHHSNPKYMEVPIYDDELLQFVRKTLDIIAYI